VTPAGSGGGPEPAPRGSSAVLQGLEQIGSPR
jgi:hypothetical protein